MSKPIFNLKQIFGVFCVALLFVGLTATTSLAQRRLTLEEAIRLAQQQSPSAQQAANTYLALYWSYRTFKSNYLPQLSLDATLPDINRSIDPIQQPDGTISYVERSVGVSSLGLRMSQAVAPLGGTLFLTSNLNRFDNFSARNANYQTNPLILGYNQPLLQFNGLSWDKKIEPLRFEGAKRNYHEQMETIALRVCNLYFDQLVAQVNRDIARLNQTANDTLFQIAKGRYDLGKIAENELLQLELSLMNARQQVARSELEVSVTSLALKNILGITSSESIELEVPGSTPSMLIAESEAIAEARKNRAATLNFKRQELEASRDLNQAIGETGLQGNLNASVGLVQTANSFEGSYMNPQNQQRVNLTFTMPILDWGRRASRRKTAESNLNLVRSQVNQAEQTFDQEVFLSVKQFEMAHKQLGLSERTSEVGQKRFDIAKARYLIGKISITDLNIAFQEKDQARQGYVSALRSAWTSYYDLRRSTLYDFSKRKVIEHDMP